MEYRELAEDIFTVSEFFSAERCAALIALAESRGFAEAPINTVFGARMAREIRNNERVMLDVPKQAAALWQKTRAWVPAVLDGWTAAGVNERFRFYRYQVGQRFRWHRDGAFERPSGQRSQLTFMVYLNEDFAGGATRFSDHVVTPKTGLALFFRHPLLHQGDPVEEGVKYVLRTDVMYDPPTEWQVPIFA